MSPGPSAMSSSAARQMAVNWSMGSRSGASSSSGTRGRWRISTGYVRPLTSTTGAGRPARSMSPWAAAETASAVRGPKCAAKRAESMVADVMTSFRSGRRGSRLER